MDTHGGDAATMANVQGSTETSSKAPGNGAKQGACRPCRPNLVLLRAPLLKSSPGSAAFSTHSSLRSALSERKLSLP